MSKSPDFVDENGNFGLDTGEDVRMTETGMTVLLLWIAGRTPDEVLDSPEIAVPLSEFYNDLTLVRTAAAICGISTSDWSDNELRPNLKGVFERIGRQIGLPPLW